MYWAIVTVTTVGYGDISPHTVVGRILASMLMIVGYGVIAVPTGIVTFEFARASAAGPVRVCSACGLQPHDTRCCLLQTLWLSARGGLFGYRKTAEIELSPSLKMQEKATQLTSNRL